MPSMTASLACVSLSACSLNPSAFAPQVDNLTNSDFKFTIASWRRQRSYIDWAVQALGGPPVLPASARPPV